jgi:hypothetical protein
MGDLKKRKIGKSSFENKKESCIGNCRIILGQRSSSGFTMPVCIFNLQNLFLVR